MALYGEWKKFANHIATLDQRIDRRIRTINRKAARKLVRRWKNGIKTKTLGLEPNAEMTIEAKGSSTPLVNHGDLLGNIKAHKVDMDGDLWFVGILETAKTEDGKDLVDIAAVMEHGSDGPIRPKKGKWLSIPVTNEAQRAGSPLNFPRKLIYIEPVWGGDQKAYFVEDNDDVTIHYVLLQKVTIPARPSMRNASKGFQEKLRKMYADGIELEIRRPFGAH